MSARAPWTFVGIVLLVATIIFAFAWIVPGARSLSEAEVQMLVDQALDTRLAEFRQQVAKQQTMQPDAVQSRTIASPTGSTDNLDLAIETYLMANPSILERMSVALQQENERRQAQQAEQALTELHREIYDDPDHVVLGNPDGDVTLVEFFDYNCGFCRKALASVLQLLDEDEELRVILKEFPILGQGSADAARIGVLVGQNDDVNYLDFHTRLFATRGQIDKQAALDVAQAVGLDPVALEARMGDTTVTAAIGRTFEVADALGINSTPNFILGNEILRGAVDIGKLRAKIANIRSCGDTTCS